MYVIIVEKIDKIKESLCTDCYNKVKEEVNEFISSISRPTPNHTNKTP